MPLFGKRNSDGPQEDPFLEQYRQQVVGSWAVIRIDDALEWGTLMLSPEGGFSWSDAIIGQNGASAGAVLVGEGRWRVEHNITFDGPCLVLSDFEQPAFAPLPVTWLITGSAHKGQVAMFDPQSGHSFVWHRR